jgi:glycerol-3-phosphate acyltransferase PlsY
MPLCAIAVTVGHIFPVQLRWHGGKGVAAAIGALAMLDVVVLAVIAASFCVTRLTLRLTMPAGMLAFLCGSAFALVFRQPGIGFATLTLTALLLFTHLGVDFWRAPFRDSNTRDR